MPEAFLNQLADQLHAKTIYLIAIAQAPKLTNLPNPHGTLLVQIG